MIDYSGIPNNSLEMLLEIYSNDIFLIVEDILTSKQTYRKVYQDILNIFKWAFEDKKIRTRKIRFKMHEKDDQIFKMEMRHFLSNLNLWYAFMEMDRVDILDESFIFDFTKFNVPNLADYIDNKILPYHEGDFISKNKMVDEISYNIRAISNAFCMLMGLSVSIHNIVQLEKRHPEMTSLMLDEIDPSLQPVEVEHMLEERTHKLIDIIINDKEYNDLKPLFLSGKVLSPNQVKEIFIKIGLKADINGNTIPMPIDANFFATGLRKPSYIYINALSGRKSLIMTKTQMSTPGAFSKKINLLATSPGMLRKDYEMCDSVRPITYHIENDEDLMYLDGRYYYDTKGDMKLLDYDIDKHLIGKTIPFRSPETCTSKEGICKYCYGHLFEINESMFSVGSLSATKNSQPAGQSVLSTKHSQFTSSDSINFNPEFDDVFELNSNEIVLKDESTNDDDLYLLLDEVEIDESSDDTDIYFTKRYKIIDQKGNLVYTIEEENTANFLLSEYLLQLYRGLRDKKTPISLDTIDTDTVLFHVEIKNHEITEPFKMVQKILNSNDRLGAQGIDEVTELFVRNLVKMGARYDYVHGEVLLRALLRKKSNELEFPDWTRNGDHNDYTILKMNTALFKNPSALISMTYGDLRRQLISPDFYNKTATSHLDALFVPKLSQYL